MDKSNVPTVVARKLDRLSPWVVLVSKTVVFPGDETPKEFHSLSQSDYVTVLGVTPDGRIPLVRQYRPALECVTWELPGGLLDSGELPQDAARREFFEETGYRMVGEPVMMGRLAPDTGRLENGLWCLFANVSREPDPSWVPEAGVEPVVLHKSELRNMILQNEFNHALHIAVLGIAQARGCFAWD